MSPLLSNFESCLGERKEGGIAGQLEDFEVQSGRLLSGSRLPENSYFAKLSRSHLDPERLRDLLVAY
ncbi:unnamed protein product [Calicophoron daubneyi]|uniref:Uncharacterized protein n=1 Tax=Calicophoron daubneyi TaxID=300641 RepID=A0AAV2SWB4_CALDB